MLSPRQLSEALLAADHLPTVPAVALEVLELCRSPDTSLEDLARAIEKDPALSVQLLRFANSPRYGVGYGVANLQRATMVLGTKAVQLMSLSISLAASLPREGRYAGFEVGTFWHRSLVRAVTARLLASAVTPHHSEEAFLCGLLQELGRFALARCLPALYGEVMEEGRGWPTNSLERRLLGFEHLDVAQRLLTGWGLPPLIATALRYSRPGQACPARLAPELVSIAHELQAADRITDLLMGQGSGLALADAQRLMTERLGLTRARGAELLDGLEEVLVETSTMLEVTLPRRAECTQVLAGAEHELEQFLSPDHGGTLEAPCLASTFTGALADEVRRRIDTERSPLGLLLFEFGAELPAAEVLRIALVLGQDLEHPHFLARHGPRGFGLIFPGHPPRRLAAQARALLSALGPDPRAAVAIGGATLERASSAEEAEVLVDAARRFLARARTREAETAIQIHPRPLRLGGASPPEANQTSAGRAPGPRK